MFYKKEHHVCSLHASVTLLGIRILNYPGLMANQQDGNYHNIDDKVGDLVLSHVWDLGYMQLAFFFAYMLIEFEYLFFFFFFGICGQQQMVV